MRRRTSLHEALAEIEAGSLLDVTHIVVSLAWWEELASNAQQGFQHRSQALGIELRADDRISSHFVELIDQLSGPPLSSERPI
jgi:hypothetical protein